MNLSGMGAPPHWRLLQRQAAREESAVKRDMNKDPIAKREKKAKPGRRLEMTEQEKMVWLPSGPS
jgi:hypothetical protein